MLAKLRPRSPYDMIAALALFLVVAGGTAYGANTIGSADIIDESILSQDIKNGEVKGLDVANGALTSDDLAANSVGSAKINDRSVKNNDLSVGASSSNTIADGGIQGIDVKDGTLTIPKLSFDPATQGELNELAGSDASPPNLGSNLVHWDVLGGVPAGFADGVDDVGSANAWSLSGNSGTDPETAFLGTTDDTGLNLRVNNARALRLEPASDGTNPSPNVIGGSRDNRIAFGVYGGTIGGGARLSSAHDSSANKVNDIGGTVGGGADNRAGNTNLTLDDATWATVAGGASNAASGSGAAVAGGESNTASGVKATVPGGDLNVAAGDFSLAAGRQAKANHQGAFVWADSGGGPVTSSAADQFTARAAGGVRLFSSSDTTGAGAPGVQLFSGTSALGTLGTGNPFDIRVGSGAASDRGLRIEPASDGTNQSPNVIGGIADNAVSSGVFGATIAGGGRGGSSFDANRVTDDQGTVGGGADNQAGNATGTTSDRSSATVGGGTSNTASGLRATVGGGSNNIAGGDWGTVAGGEFNDAGSGQHSTVGGGLFNNASGPSATVPGGQGNTALGDSSFAAGGGAHAVHAGAFVWADSSDSDADGAPDTISSLGANQFIARASGNFFLQSDSSLDDQSGFINTSTGGFLSTGGAWTNSSDRRLKSGFDRVEPLEVLERVAKLPVTSWQYDAEPGVRHIGPVAQDFHRAFRLGNDNRHIASIDADGVALAAIKALAAQNRRLSHRLRAESRRRSRQSRRIARLERGLAALRQHSKRRD
jgi:trimeric autotransporter adhesin